MADKLSFVKLVLTLSVVTIFISLLDYCYKRCGHEEEYKQHEGDPSIKGAIKRPMRQLAKGRTMKEVPKASIVGDKAPMVPAKSK